MDDWRSCGWAEGDGVAEVLELFDEVVAAPVGVGVAGEVVAAEVVVVLVVGERTCQAMTRMEWLTATAAFFLPIRRASRQNWAAR